MLKAGGDGRTRDFVMRGDSRENAYLKFARDAEGCEGAKEEVEGEVTK
jgi:hypothetical protein